MSHTWSDVAYGFVNGSGVKGDMSPLELLVMMGSAVAMLYIYGRFR